MATEQDRQEERDRLGNEPFQAPPAEVLEEENPLESPAADQDQEGDAEGDGDAARQRASTTMEPPRQVATSTEGLTVGGTKKEPSA